MQTITLQEALLITTRPSVLSRKSRMFEVLPLDITDSIRARKLSKKDAEHQLMKNSGKSFGKLRATLGG